MNDADLVELAAVFRVEAAANLETIEQALLALETGGVHDPAALAEILRAAHTLKGNSALIGYDAVTRAAHELEDGVEALVRHARAATLDETAELLLAVDELRRLIAAAAAPATAGPAPAALGAATLRIGVSRLDTLLTLTGEIAIASGRVTALAPGDGALGAALWQLEQLHAALQKEVMAARLVPLGPALRRQQRTLRDVARQTGKLARLVIEGDDVALDTRVAEQIHDPLTHMMRNAVDHGLEAPDERLARGKPAEGTVTLRAEYAAGAVTITVRDDGRGLDRARIAARAEAAGLVADAAALDDAALFALIFEAGFSTAARVTEVSGRGVGMDVVRRHVQALRGTIAIASAPGRGTTFTIRLPLSVAILDGFIVASGEERYVLPLDAVDECLDFSAATDGGATGVLNLRGRAVPWIRLTEVLGLPAEPTPRASIVVVKAGERRTGLVVDALEGSCQAVLKPLTGLVATLPGVAGSTILGSGRVALMLDVPALVARAARPAA